MLALVRCRSVNLDAARTPLSVHTRDLGNLRADSLATYRVSPLASWLNSRALGRHLIEHDAFRSRWTGGRRSSFPDLCRIFSGRCKVSHQRADNVMKSRAHHGSKNVYGPWTMPGSSAMPLPGAASCCGAEGW